MKVLQLTCSDGRVAVIVAHIILIAEADNGKALIFTAVNVPLTVEESYDDVLELLA